MVARIPNLEAEEQLNRTALCLQFNNFVTLGKITQHLWASVCSSVIAHTLPTYCTSLSPCEIIEVERPCGTHHITQYILLSLISLNQLHPPLTPWEISVLFLALFCIFCSYGQMGQQFPIPLNTRQDRPLSILQSWQSLWLEAGNFFFQGFLTLIGTLWSPSLFSYQTSSLLYSTMGQNVLLKLLSISYKI